MKLNWEKSSYKRYCARGTKGAIEVVRYGSRAFGNERWRPHVFGNQFAGPTDGFIHLEAAMDYAEEVAIEYSNAIIAKLCPAASPQEGKREPGEKP